MYEGSSTSVMSMFGATEILTMRCVFQCYAQKFLSVLKSEFNVRKVFLKLFTTILHNYIKCNVKIRYPHQSCHFIKLHLNYF